MMVVSPVPRKLKAPLTEFSSTFPFRVSVLPEVILFVQNPREPEGPPVKFPVMVKFSEPMTTAGAEEAPLLAMLFEITRSPLMA